MSKTRAAPVASATQRASLRISLALCIGSCGLMVAVATLRLLRDPSFWIDEAAIALSLLHLEPRELAGPLLTPHSFPRIYLSLVYAMKSLFGYETLVLRALPFCAFVLGALAWHRLVFVRFGARPLLLALFVALNLVPPTWLAYSMLLKQYSLDVALALVPFLISDDFFDRRLRRGKIDLRLLMLPSLTLLSFTFVIPILARVLGWYGLGWLRGERRVAPGPVALVGLLMIAGLGGAYALDMRHTAGLDPLFAFWSACAISTDPLDAPSILYRFVTSWYTASLAFSASRSVPAAVVVLLAVATALGVLEILRRATRAAAEADEAVQSWGSRSAAALVCIGGLAMASLLVGYPMCSGRLTLFALFPLQLISLEGISGLDRLARSRRARLLAGTAIVILIASVVPSAASNLSKWIFDPALGDIRPLVRIMDAEPELPVLTGACGVYEISTLPEWRGRPGILSYELELAEGRGGHPDADEYFIIIVGFPQDCRGLIQSIRELDADVVPQRVEAVFGASLSRVSKRPGGVGSVPPP